MDDYQDAFMTQEFPDNQNNAAIASNLLPNILYSESSFATRIEDEFMASHHNSEGPLGYRDI